MPPETNRLQVQHMPLHDTRMMCAAVPQKQERGEELNLAWKRPRCNLEQYSGMFEHHMNTRPQGSSQERCTVSVSGFHFVADQFVFTFFFLSIFSLNSY